MKSKKRWGYKGVETSLNGLTNWILDRVPMKGSSNERYDNACKMIVEYAVKNIVGFYAKGPMQSRADKAAKLIQVRKLFQAFAQYFDSIDKTTLP